MWNAISLTQDLNSCRCVQFLQIMNMLLNDVDFTIAYLDNILIKSESQEQHAEHIKEVFEQNKAIWLET